MTKLAALLLCFLLTPLANAELKKVTVNTLEAEVGGALARQLIEILETAKVELADDGVYRLPYMVAEIYSNRISGKAGSQTSLPPNPPGTLFATLRSKSHTPFSLLVCF